MRKIRRELLAGVSLFLVAVPSWGAQAGSSAPAQAPNTAPAPLQTPDQATTTSKPDHSGAYYHFMMARRYQELAGIYDRSDYHERAISNTRPAMDADPDSLCLQREPANSTPANRVGDAVREARRC